MSIDDHLKVSKKDFPDVLEIKTYQNEWDANDRLGRSDGSYQWKLLDIITVTKKEPVIVKVACKDKKGEHSFGFFGERIGGPTKEKVAYEENSRTVYVLGRFKRKDYY